MLARVLKVGRRLLVLGCAVLVSTSLSAQAVPSVKGKSGETPSPKWEIFAGYSYLSPHGTVMTRTSLHGTPKPFSYVPVYGEMDFSIARFLTGHWGLEINGDIHLENDNPHPGKYEPRNEFSGGSGGVIYRFRNSATTPFVHLLMGAEIADGPHWQLDHWGPVGTVGGGFDCDTSLLKHHLALRLIQADYQYVYEDFDGLNGTNIQAGIAHVNALRLSAGAVFHSAAADSREPLALSCSVNHASVYPGQPVTVTATADHLNPRKSVSYSWSGTGAGGSGATTTVDTYSLAPGIYTVKVQVREDKPSRECLRVLPAQWADCSASFTVKAFDPPVIRCAANPGTIYPDQSSTITATAASPQNRPLKYSYTANGGTINGSGATATYIATGAPTGPMRIFCNVTDDGGLTATATTDLTILPRPVPPVQHTQALCSISFSKDKVRPSRLDNEAKACLDEVTLNLAKQPDAKIVLVGEANAPEKEKSMWQAKRALKNKRIHARDLATERAVNAKDYLVKEKGIDAARIAVATSPAEAQKVENYLVPAGASFATDVQGTTPVK